MTATPATADRAPHRAAEPGLALTADGRRWHRPLVLVGAACLLVALASLAAIPFDDRTLLGEPVWIKSFKFGFALGAYCLTLAWLLANMTRLRRSGWVLGTLFAALTAVEYSVIVAAAAAGTFSHFNNGDDTLNRVVQFAFQFVPLMFVSNTAIAVLVLFQRIGDRAVTTVIRWGLLLASLGMAAAFFILSVGGESERTRENAAGEEVVLTGAHGVGDPDGNGMFLTGWSTTGGDLRVSHFLGLHGIQVLIALAMLLGLVAARRAWLREDRVRAGILRWSAVGYLGIFATTVWQAVRGQSFIAPDAATLAAFAASVLAAAIGVAVTVARAKRREAELQAELQTVG